MIHVAVGFSYRGQLRSRLRLWLKQVLDPEDLTMRLALVSASSPRVALVAVYVCQGTFLPARAALLVAWDSTSAQSTYF